MQRLYWSKHVSIVECIVFLWCFFFLLVFITRRRVFTVLSRKMYSEIPLNNLHNSNDSINSPFASLRFISCFGLDLVVLFGIFSPKLVALNNSMFNHYIWFSCFDWITRALWIWRSVLVYFFYNSFWEWFRPKAAQKLWYLQRILSSSERLN